MMNQKPLITIISFIILLLFSSKSIAQKQDSSKLRTIYYTTSMMDEDLSSFENVDSSLDYFHEYNPSFGYNFFGSSTANLSCNFYSRKFELLHGTGFNSGFYLFDQFKLLPSEVKFYDTYTPFTDVYYVQGNKEFQIIRATHTRNITPNWNIGFDLFSSHSDGFYTNQKSGYRNINLNTNYISKNGNYRLLAAMTWNNAKMNSNGGINDSFYASYTLKEQLYANVFLEKAQQLYKEKDVYLRQYLGLKPKDKNDTAKVFLVHELNYLTSGYGYYDEDPIPLYYRNIYIDSSFTSDSFHFAELTNTFFIQNRIFEGKNKTNFKLGVRHSIGKISQNSLDTGYYNFTSILNLNKKIRNFNFSMESEIVLSGANASDYSFREEVTWYTGKETVLLLGSIQQKTKPDYLLNQIYSNHLMWSNSFNPVSCLSAFVVYQNEKYHLQIKGAYSLLQKAVYMTSDILPVQKSSSTYHLLLQIKKELKIGKFHFDNNIALQYSNDANVISLPFWSVNNLTYFETGISKKQMKLQIGVALRIQDAYYSDAYFAPFNILYGQGDFLLETYPMLDAFLNVSLKRARVFVKMQHVNQGYPEFPAYLFPYYPADPRAFRFGISWMFFD